MRAVGCLIVVALLFIVSVGPSKAEGVELNVLSPMQGEKAIGTSITVVFEAANFQITHSSVPIAEAGKRPDANRAGEGHVHLMLDLQPLVVWEESTPYTFENVTPGFHQVSIELVNNDHSSLTPPIVMQRTVEVVASQGQATGDTAAAPSSEPQMNMLPNTGADQQLDYVRIELIVLALMGMVGGLALNRQSRRWS